MMSSNSMGQLDSCVHCLTTITIADTNISDVTQKLKKKKKKGQEHFFSFYI